MSFNGLFPFPAFDFDGIQGSDGPLKYFDKGEEVLSKEKQDHYMSEMEMGETSPISNEHGFQQGDTSNKGVLILDEFDFKTISISQPAQPIQGSSDLAHSRTKGSELPEHSKQISQPQPYSLASLELLRNCGSGFKKLKGQKLNDTTTETSVGGHKLSTKEIMRVAGARFVHFSVQNLMNDHHFVTRHPFGCALSGLSDEEIKDVELVHHLLAVAEKVGCKQYDRATKLLLGCKQISSAKGNQVERIVSHFAEVLQERIDKETGRVSIKGLQQYDEIIHLYLNTNFSFLKIHQQLPFTQITQFTGIQAILDNVALKRKVHLIDVGIRWGVHWTVLMQGLAERQNRPIELLKITAVGSTGNQIIDETGKRLVSFAESLNLRFSFKSVLLSDFNNIKKELFETENDEDVIIYASHILRTMISRPKCLENFMRVIKNLNPSMMVVIEVDANHNSPIFVDRFIEALSFHSAHYDCVETCMKENDEDRSVSGYETL